MKIKKVLFLLYATSLAPFSCFTQDNNLQKQERSTSAKNKKKKPDKKEQTPPIQMPTFEFIPAQSVETMATAPEIKFSTDKNIQSFSMVQPTIIFTSEGISTFFNHTFNRKEYGTDFLPHNFTHMVQFLRYAYNTNQPLEFSEGVIRLFNQKLKGSSYVSAPAFERFLTQATDSIEYKFAQKPCNLWHEFKSTLWSTFKKNFTFLQRHPDGFFEELSKQLERQVETSVTSPDRARATLIRFCCANLDKAIWCAQDQEETWHCFKKIGGLLCNLHTKKVITDALDVNEMYWSLVERYCFFLELSGNQLSLQTCATIKQDLTANSIPWLLHKEQEAHTQTKAERLITALLETEVRIRLNQKEFAPKPLASQA